MLHKLQTTIPCKTGDFQEWHRGRKSYAAWVLVCDNNTQIRGLHSSAREYLNGYLLEPYIRQPHITLYTCGFVDNHNQYNDDFTQVQLDTQIQALKKANIGSFELETGDINSFGSAPFFEIHDPDEGIAQIRGALVNSTCEFRTVPYLPHLTIGLYSGVFSSIKVLEHLAGFENSPIRWEVNEISLVTYQATEIAGELTNRYRFSLMS